MLTTFNVSVHYLMMTTPSRWHAENSICRVTHALSCYFASVYIVSGDTILSVIFIIDVVNSL